MFFKEAKVDDGLWLARTISTKALSSRSKFMSGVESYVLEMPKLVISLDPVAPFSRSFSLSVSIPRGCDGSRVQLWLYKRRSSFGPEAGKRGRRDATTFPGTSTSTKSEEC